MAKNENNVNSTKVVDFTNDFKKTVLSVLNGNYDNIVIVDKKESEFEKGNYSYKLAMVVIFKVESSFKVKDKTDIVNFWVELEEPHEIGDILGDGKLKVNLLCVPHFYSKFTDTEGNSGIWQVRRTALSLEKYPLNGFVNRKDVKVIKRNFGMMINVLNIDKINTANLADTKHYESFVKALEQIGFTESEFNQLSEA